MHSVVVAVEPLARRHAFREADEVLYFGQLQTRTYQTRAVHSIYLRDKSEIHVLGHSATEVERRATELRLKLSGDIEYIAGVVYTKGLAQRNAAKAATKEKEWH